MLTDPITYKQRAYIAALVAQREVPVPEDLDGLLDVMTRETASETIDRLRAYPLRQVTAAAIASIAASAKADLVVGIYRLPEDGTIVKVQKAVHGSGKLYAKRLVEATGKFAYEPGLVFQVQAAGVKLTLADAQQYGKLYGMCVVCARTLTDETSIADGIGPVCKKKFA